MSGFGILGNTKPSVDDIADVLEAGAGTADLTRVQSAVSVASFSTHPEKELHRVSLRLPSGTVSTKLTGYVARVALDTLPDVFWSGVSTGGANVRAYDAFWQMLPIDVTYADARAKIGEAYIKLDALYADADTHIHLIAHDKVTAPSAAGSGYDKTAVWSGYERVYMPGQTVDRTGKSSSGLVRTNAGEFGAVRRGPNLAPAHQQVLSSGDYYYAIHTNEIRKYDMHGNLLVGPVNITANGLGATVNHFGAGVIIGSELFVTCEYYPAATYDHQYLCVYDVASLVWKRNINISATLRETSGVCWDGQYLYVTDFNNGASIPRYLIDGTPAGVLTLSPSMTLLQGCAFYDGNLYLSRDLVNGVGRLYKVDPATGTVTLPSVYSSTFEGNFEGISSDANGIIITADTPSGTYPIHVSRSPLLLDCDGTQYAKSDAPVLSSWTLGVNMRITRFTTHNMTAVSYGGPTVTGTTDRASIAYRNISTALGAWNSAGSWLFDASPVDLWEDQYVQLAHTPTGRTLCVNGLIASDASVATRPVGGPAYLYIGQENDTAGETFLGQVGLVTLRSGSASQAELLATNLFSSGMPWQVAANPRTALGADYLATTIGGMTGAQSAVAKLPKVSFSMRNQSVPLAFGALSIKLGASPPSLEYALDHSGNAVQISRLTGATSSNNYLYNNPYVANVYQKVHPGLNITDAGAMQECTIHDMTTGVTYICTLIVGAGYAGNVLKIEILQ
jgi:hypothetical protein